MSDDALRDIEAEAARLVEQAEAIKRDLAELQRLAKKYNFLIVKPGAAQERRAIETLISLMERYQSDPRSPYHKVAYYTRKSYDRMLKRLTADFGTIKLSELNAITIQAQYDRWRGDGKD